ncbi:iron chaperone [Pedobacter agri]|uniref:iron chaperone n=1 Tax=Pedobacter agri TaxID=454586 RepID=UPI00292D6652|nr:DUF1801 domain-containing protein [Pedobacter agri]
MNTNKTDIESYIADFPEETRAKLQFIKEVIQKAAPDATEKISYAIPTFDLKGNLVHFAGYKNHIGFYPGSAAIEVFKEELSTYETSKGTVQFPLTQPIPTDLVTKITLFRVAQNLEKAAQKTKKKSG